MRWLLDWKGRDAVKNKETIGWSPLNTPRHSCWIDRICVPQSQAQFLRWQSAFFAGYLPGIDGALPTAVSVADFVWHLQIFVRYWTESFRSNITKPWSKLRQVKYLGKGRATGSENHKCKQSSQLQLTCTSNPSPSPVSFLTCLAASASASCFLNSAHVDLRSLQVLS